MTSWTVVGAFVVAASMGQQSAPPKQKPDYTQKCSAAACHGSLLTRPVVHSPLTDEACDACHEQADGATHRFTLASEDNDLCLDCHDEFEGAVMHAPVSEGSCTDCHDPHGSNSPKLILADSEAQLCNECHEDVFEDMTFLHGPVAAQSCTVCHSAHASEIPKLLLEPERKLCVDCHEDMDAKNAAGKQHVHEPVSEGCVACHNPHGADNKMILTSVPPALCVDCHDEIGELVDEAKVSHDVVDSGKSCLNCHTAHISKQEKLLTQSGMSLCLSCHDTPVKSGDETLQGMKAELSKPNPHGPLLEKDCGGCHNPHASDNYRLLQASYPSRFYSAYSEEAYGICFECHDAEAMEEEETDSATEFRNGEQNLHFIHVNKDVKGRTCRACHEPHASTLAMLVAESVPFGKWQIPLNFKRSERGGSCQPGCHRAYRYDREEPIVNIRQAKSEEKKP